MNIECSIRNIYSKPELSQALKRNHMAFVYRSTNKQNNQHQAADNIGPGSYFRPKPQSLAQNKQSPAPFNNTSSRKIWDKNLVPGPGTYEGESGILKQKKLASDEKGNFVVYQTPQQQGVFKSKTKRFTEEQKSRNNLKSQTNNTNSIKTHSVSPGPGQYFTSQNKSFERKSLGRPCTGQSSPLRNSGTKLNQFLKNRNMQDSAFIPSDEIIAVSNQMSPDTKDHFAPNKSQQRCLAFEKSYQKVQGEDKKVKNKKRAKGEGSIFFASKVQRTDLTQIRPQTSAGPGSYNVQKQQREKPSPQLFRSPTKSICVTRQEKAQLQEVGPGSYDVQKAFNSMTSDLSKNKKRSALSANGKLRGGAQCFGSTVDRFQVLKNDILVMSPGPAAYETDLKSFNQTRSSLCASDPKKNINHNRKSESFKNGFGCQERKLFESKSNPNISPGVYTTQNDFTCLLRDKYKKGTVGSFGSTQERFKQKNSNASQNILTYTKSVIQTPSEDRDSKFKRLGLQKKRFHNLNTSHRNKCVDQSLGIGMQSEHKNDQNNHQKLSQSRPLCYDSQVNTLGWKYSSKGQVEAPFMSGSHRFESDLNHSLRDVLIQDPIKQNKKKSVTVTKPTVNSSSACSMRFTEARFKYEEDRSSPLGPQFYNPSKIGAKSHNVLFN